MRLLCWLNVYLKAFTNPYVAADSCVCIHSWWIHQEWHPLYVSWSLRVSQRIQIRRHQV